MKGLQEKKMFGRYGSKVTAAATAAALGGTLALAGIAGGAPRKPTGNLTVEIAAAGDVKWNECTLSFRHGEGSVKKGTRSYLFRDVPAGSYTLIADGLVKGGLFGSDKRLFAAAEANVAANRENRVTVTLEPSENIDSFCSACHPTRNEPLEAGQIVRDVHRSGTILPKDHVEKVKAYNRETEELRKKGETERLTFPLEERKVDSGGKRVKATIFTCESCHTFHRETPYPSYVRASYRTGGDLCTGCHP